MLVGNLLLFPPSTNPHQKVKTCISSNICFVFDCIEMLSDCLDNVKVFLEPTRMNSVTTGGDISAAIGSEMLPMVKYLL